MTGDYTIKPTKHGFAVFGPKGRQLGVHRTRSDAERQIGAIRLRSGVRYGGKFGRR